MATSQSCLGLPKINLDRLIGAETPINFVLTQSLTKVKAVHLMFGIIRQMFFYRKMSHYGEETTLLHFTKSSLKNKVISRTFNYSSSLSCKASLA